MTPLLLEVGRSAFVYERARGIIIVYFVVSEVMSTLRILTSILRKFKI